jgi:hypothetical protein
VVSVAKLLEGQSSKMAIEIKNTNKISANDGIKAVVYGPSGVGKTRLAVTATRPLVLSAEEGLLSLRKESVPYIEIANYKDLTDAVNWFLKSAEAKKNVDTLFLDSMSEIAELVLAYELSNTKDPRKAYGNMQQQMYQIMRLFRGIDGKNIVLICKQIFQTDGVNQKAVPIMPSAALLAQVPYFWDLVLHMTSLFAGNGQMYTAFHTKDNPSWTAKDRSGNLDEIEEPNLQKLFNKCLL